MIALRNQSALVVRAQWIAGGVAVVLAVGFYFAVYRPNNARFAALQEKISSQREQLLNNQSRALELPSLMRRVDKLQFEVTRNGKKMPKSLELGRFMGNLTSLAQQSSLRNFSVIPTGSKRLELFTEQPICLSFEGGFLQAAQFLRQIEEFERITRVRRLSIQNQSHRDGKVNVELTMNIYFSELP